MRTTTTVFAEQLPTVSFRDYILDGKGWFSTLEVKCGDSSVVIHLPKGTTLDQVTDMLRTFTVSTCGNNLGIV